VTRNGITVHIPIGLSMGGKEEMTDGGCQIMLQEDTRMMNEQILAMTHFTKYICPSYERILHPFAGVGMMAQVIDKACGNKSHMMWERDPELVKYLREHGYGNVELVEDSYTRLLDSALGVYDVIMYDQMLGTIKNPYIMEFWARAAKQRVPLVWMTDSAASKIWLHRSHYVKELGREVKDEVDYLRAYNDRLAYLGYVIAEAWMEPSRMMFFAAVKEMNTEPFHMLQRLKP